MNLHYGPRQVFLWLLCSVALSCREEAKFKNGAGSGVDLIVRYLTEVRRRRACHDQICREVLVALGNEPGIDLAYPTRRNVTETKVLPTLPGPSPRWQNE
jgi:hypothetical protein